MFRMPYCHLHHYRDDFKPSICLYTENNIIMQLLYMTLYVEHPQANCKTTLTCYCLHTHLGVLPNRLLVHLKVDIVLNLLSPPSGASTSPLSRPRYSVKATVISSTPVDCLETRSRKCVRLALSWLQRIGCSVS